MVPIAPDDRFRAAAEAENGQPVSAGGRVAHESAWVTSGRGVYLDLTAVPEQLRGRILSDIQDLIRTAVGPSPARAETPSGQPASS